MRPAPGGGAPARKTRHIGTYDTAVEAARAYDEVARAFGRDTNFSLVAGFMVQNSQIY